MKAAACLVGICLLAGIVSADYAWETGKSYTYTVNSRALAGITEINNEYAGLQFSYDLICTPMGGNFVNVQFKNLQVLEVNEQLEQGWTQTPIEQGRVAEIPSELQTYLTSPMNMKVVKGVVESIQVEGNLPTWAINIKKAQASTFTADTTGKNVVVEGNLNRKTNSVRPEQANQESGFFYEVVEETVHGECEVYYTVSQNGPFDYPYQFQKDSQAGRQSRQGGQQTQSSSSSESQSQSQSQEQGQRRKQIRGTKASSSSSSSSSSSEESSVEKPWPKAFYNLCEQNDQVYEIIKTVNFTTCSQKPVLAYSSPAELNFHPADNAGGSLWTRALVTRMLACGQSRQNYTILKITQQERIHTGLRDEEKVVAGTQKNVTLISIRQGHPSPVHSPKTINNLVYQYDPEEQRQQLNGGGQQRQQQQQSQSQSGSSSQEFTTSSSYKQSSSEEYQKDASYLHGKKQNQFRSGSQSGSQEQGQQQQGSGSSEEQQYQQSGQKLPKPSMDKAPLASMLITPLNKEQMMQRVDELMREIVQDLTTSTQSPQDSIAQRETLSTITTLVKVIRVLDFQEIQQVSRKWLQGGTQRLLVGQQIFREAVSIAGTNPAIKFLVELIKSGQLHGEWAAQVISTLPLYVRTPTPELLNLLFQLLESEVVKRHEQTRTSAILAFSTLANQACVNKKTKNTRYPVALYGEFCSPQRVQQQYAPYFIQKLEKLLQQNQVQDKHLIFVYFKALGNLGVPEIIPVVQKALDEQSEPIIKVKAIYALQNLIQSRGNLNQQNQQQQDQQQQGQQQKQPISADRQSYEVVTDKLVEKYVLPLLASVAFDSGEHPSVRAAAISLLVHCTYADTALWQQLAMSTWFERSRSIHSLIHSLIYSLAKLDSPLTGRQWVQQQKARQVINLLKPIDASLARSHKLFTAQFVEDVNSGFSQQFQWIESKDSIIPNYAYYHSFYNFGNGAARVSPLEASLSGNTISKLIFAVYDAIQGNSQQQQQQQGQAQGQHPEMDQIRSLLNINSRQQEDPVVGNLFINVRNEMQRMWTIDEKTLEQYVQQIIGYVMQTGEKQMPVNYQKVAQLAEHVFSMPTALGFPLVYRMRMSSLLSVRGQVQISSLSGPKGFQVQADLSPIAVWKVHRQLAFKSPFTQKKYQAGVQRHFVAELPFSVVGQKTPRGKIQVAITPTHLGRSPKGTIDLFTYHQQPYTAIIHDEFYPVVHPKGGKLQVVHVDQERQYTQTSQFGQKALGLHFQVHEQSDFPREQETVSGWTRFFRQFHTTNCAFNAAWLGSPSIRYAQRKLVLNLDQSETSTLVLVTGAKFQRVSVVQKLQSSEEAGQNQNSGSGSSSSSSESQEGQKYFENVRSPNNYHKQLSRHNKQQQQRLSGSQSQSNSNSQSQSNSQSGSQESQHQSGEAGKKAPQTNVIAIALLGKKAALKPILQTVQRSQGKSSSEEQNQSGQQSNSQEQGQQYGQQSSSRKQGQQYGQQSSSRKQGQQYGRNSSSRQQGQQYGRYSSSRQQGQQYGQQSSSQEQGQQYGQQSSSQEQGQQYGQQSSSQEQGQQYGQQSSSQEQGQQVTGSGETGQGAIQPPLQKGSRNTVQYLLHIAQSAQGKLFLRLSIGGAANQAAESLPQSQSLQGVREAVAGSPNGQSQPDACIEFQGTIDTPKRASRHVIAYTRKSLLEQNLSVKIQAQLQAGKNCRLMPVFVKVQGKLQRDQEMTEWAQTKSPKAQRCTADEKKGFSVSQVCLEVAREQAAALNEMQLNIEHSRMPAGVKNVTAQLETLIKAMGYMYLSENQVPESSPAQERQIKLWARMTPCKRFISFHVHQQQSILKFENMKTNQVVKALLPLTATNTVVGNVQRRLLRSQFHPTCQLEGKYVNTFDNVTYSFNRKVVQQCQTLLARDCSGRYPMAVYAKNIQQNEEQIVTILLGQQTKIQLIPKNADTVSSKGGKTSGVSSNSPIIVRVNNQEISLPHIIRDKQSSNKQPIAEIMQIPNGGIQVLGRRIQVASDGQRILLKIHELLRNRTCGICGDFDNEKVADMRSPRDVPLSSGSLLVASYSFELEGSISGTGKSAKGIQGSQGKCTVHPQYQRQVQIEEQRFQSQSRNQYTSKNQRGGKQYILAQQQQNQIYSPYLQQSALSRSSSESSEQSNSGEQSSKLVYQQRVLRNPHNPQETCVTLNKLPTCAYPSQPQKMVQKMTQVYCMPTGHQAEQIKQKIQAGQHYDLSSKQQQQKIRVAVPQKCSQ